MAKYYFLASSLPPLPSSLGEKLSLPFDEICQTILRNIEPGDEPLVRCCLLRVDTGNAEFFLQGENVFLPGGSLTREDVEGKRHLPLFMRAFLDDRDRGLRRRYVYDSLWEGYFAHTLSVAADVGCRFLTDYLSWEIGLRNSLVGLRARALGEEPDEYQVLARAGSHDFSALLSQWRAQYNPLKAELFLDEERLKTIYHFEGSDPFSRDAVLGILEKARIYSRWERLNVEYPILDLI
jgi:hypothetical protein